MITAIEARPTIQTNGRRPFQFTRIAL